MAKTKEPVNPFYVLLVVLGIVFLITACAYGTMAYRAITPVSSRAPTPEPDAASEPHQSAPESHPLMTFLDQHGMQLMGVELALLAAATFGAMWLDQFRARQTQPGSARPPETDIDAESGRKMR